MSSADTLPPAILLMGPTATGKTEMALRLCDLFPCEIISVDSALVYRGMDIGTAKPAKEVLANYPHALVDILDPAESYSAAMFRHDALSHMAEITARGRVPLLVGGTMLYFRALQQGLSQLPEADAGMRELLQQRLSKEGLPALHAELARIDSPSAARININDPQRILRALEICLLSGQPMSRLLAQHRDAGLAYRVLKLALWADDRRELHQRIAERFTGMLSNGFVDEVAGLKTRANLDLNKPSMRAVGYRQVWQYLDGEFGAAEMQEKGIIATRQLAKRQMTWLRAEPGLCRIDFRDAVRYPLVDTVRAFLD